MSVCNRAENKSYTLQQKSLFEVLFRCWRFYGSCCCCCYSFFLFVCVCVFVSAGNLAKSFAPLSILDTWACLMLYGRMPVVNCTQYTHIDEPTRAYEEKALTTKRKFVGISRVSNEHQTTAYWISLCALCSVYTWWLRPIFCLLHAVPCKMFQFSVRQQ